MRKTILEDMPDILLGVLLWAMLWIAVILLGLTIWSAT